MIKYNNLLNVHSSINNIIILLLTKNYNKKINKF